MRVCVYSPVLQFYSLKHSEKNIWEISSELDRIVSLAKLQKRILFRNFIFQLHNAYVHLVSREDLQVNSLFHEFNLTNQRTPSGIGILIVSRFLGWNILSFKHRSGNIFLYQVFTS